MLEKESMLHEVEVYISFSMAMVPSTGSLGWDKDKLIKVYLRAGLKIFFLTVVLRFFQGSTLFKSEDIWKKDEKRNTTQKSMQPFSCLFVFLIERFDLTDKCHHHESSCVFNPQFLALKRCISKSIACLFISIC